MADPEARCPLCGRVLGTVNVDRHHLVPKSFKGTEQFLIHRICHRKIHSAFTEKELAHKYNTWEALRATPEIQDFLTFVAKKDPGYYAPSRSSNDKKRR